MTPDFPDSISFSSSSSGVTFVTAARGQGQLAPAGRRLVGRQRATGCSAARAGGHQDAHDIRLRILLAIGQRVRLALSSAFRSTPAPAGIPHVGGHGALLRDNAAWSASAARRSLASHPCHAHQFGDQRHVRAPRRRGSGIPGRILAPALSTRRHVGLIR